MIICRASFTLGSMKITDIKSFPVWVGRRNQLIVKVYTDCGLYGLGESGLSAREHAVAGAVRHYRELLIGKDPMQRGAIWQQLYRSQYFEGGRALTAAISAIDIALHDIAGKALNVPVHQLLGGKQRDRVPCFVTTALPSGPPETEALLALVEGGWRVIRFGISRSQNKDPLIFEPWEAVATSADLLMKARESVGTGIVLGIDFHHRLSVAEAASFCRRMTPGTLDFLEEPIRAESPEAYAALRKMTTVPFAVGEEFSSKWAFLPFIEQGLTDFVRLDICNVGGFTEAAKVAGWAEAHYVDIMPHNPLGPVCTAASVHLCAAVPNMAWLEVRPELYDSEQIGSDQKELFSGVPTFEGDGFLVPDTPGLGVDFDEDRAAERNFRFWNPPLLRRRDGSHTNW